MEELISKQDTNINASTTVCIQIALCMVYEIVIWSFNQFGCTALHYASRQGSVEFVKLLMDHGADVDIGRTVSDLIIHVSLVCK